MVDIHGHEAIWIVERDVKSFKEIVNCVCLGNGYFYPERNSSMIKKILIS